MLQINSGLLDSDGLKNKNTFMDVILKVNAYFIHVFGEETMNKIDIYVDNATRDSGHTPRINPVFNKFLHIKLCITPESHEGIITFQFAHELMHYIHYCHYGFERQHEDIQYIREENVCTAASLIVVHDLYPQYFCDLDAYARGLLDIRYQKGAELAEQFKYNLLALKGLV